MASHRNSSVEGISIAILPNTLSEILANPRVGKVRLVNCHCHWLAGLLESRTKFMVSSLVALCCHTLRGRRICTDCADCNVCLLALAATDCGKVTAKVILSLYGPWSSTAQHIRRAQIESLQVRKKETRRLRHLMVLMRIFALTLDWHYTICWRVQIERCKTYSTRIVKVCWNEMNEVGKSITWAKVTTPKAPNQRTYLWKHEGDW